MKIKKILWESVLVEFENDLKLDEESHCICDIIHNCGRFTPTEINILMKDMQSYAIKNELRIGAPFWDTEDLESRRNFINERIKENE